MKIRWRRAFEDVILKIGQLQYKAMYLNVVKEIKLKYSTTL